MTMKKFLIKVLLLSGLLVAGANNDFFPQTKKDHVVSEIALGETTYEDDLIKGEH
jgi:outer membrane murein-binding lipoprotein Lpp